MMEYSNLTDNMKQVDMVSSVDDDMEDEIDLSEYISLLYENRYLIASVSSIFVLSFICYFFNANIQG